MPAPHLGHLSIPVSGYSPSYILEGLPFLLSMIACTLSHNPSSIIGSCIPSVIIGLAFMFLLLFSDQFCLTLYLTFPIYTGLVRISRIEPTEKSFPFLVL